MTGPHYVITRFQVRDRNQPWRWMYLGAVIWSGDNRRHPFRQSRGGRILYLGGAYRRQDMLIRVTTVKKLLTTGKLHDSLGSA